MSGESNKSESLPSLPAWRAAHLVERLARLQRAEGFEAGLNPAQWEALRYLSRANRFSRTPAALAEFLAASRGTVSQTLIALEGKRLVRKTANERDARSVALALTAAGRRMLAGDRERALARDIDATGEAAPLARALEAALRRALERRGARAFGVCKTCRHFRAGAGAGADAAHHCALLDAPLSAQDAQAICVEMEAA